MKDTAKLLARMALRIQTVLACAAAASCAGDGVTAPDGRRTVTEIRVVTDAGFPETRSHVGDGEALDRFESAAMTLTVFQFARTADGSRRLEGVFHSDLSAGEPATVSGVSGREYRYYALLNCGDLSSSLERGTPEEEVLELAVSCPVQAMTEEGGMPMACGPVDAALSSGSPLSLRFTRLPARFDFRLEKELGHGTFVPKSLRIRQSPTVTLPFATSNAMTEEMAAKVADGDWASASDLEALSNGGTVRYYTLENACGRPLDNPSEDPRLKVPETGNSVGGYLPTYLELTGTYTDLSGGLKSENTYRMYLGENSYDSFDVLRGTRYSLTLSIGDEGGFLEGYWKLEPDVTDSRSFRFSSREYRVDGGSSTVVGVTGDSPHYGITYSLDGALSGVSFDPSTMRLSQGKAGESRTGTLTAYYWDGRMADRCSVTALAYRDPEPTGPIGMVNVSTSWDSRSYHSIHSPSCRVTHTVHNPSCRINHVNPLLDDYMDIADCDDVIDNTSECRNRILVPTGAGQVSMSFQIAADYGVTRTGRLVYSILTPGTDYRVTSCALLDIDGNEGDDEVQYATVEYSGNTVKVGAQFQDAARTHWHVSVEPLKEGLDGLERHYIVASGGSGPVVYPEAPVTYPNTEVPHTYSPICGRVDWRVWILSDATRVTFANTDDPDRGNSFVSGEEMVATVMPGRDGEKTRVYALDMNGCALKESIFDTDECTCDITRHGYFTDPLRASALEFSFHSGFDESLMPVTVMQDNVMLLAELDGHRTAYSTVSDREFSLWTDGYRVSAVLFLQEEFDSYSWDAYLDVGLIDRHTFNVAADGTWTLE